MRITTFLLSVLLASPAFSALDAEFVSQEVPTDMVAGRRYRVSVTMRNTGTTSWTRLETFRLGSVNPYDNLTWAVGRVELDEGDRIEPGQVKTFSFPITASKVSGANQFQWRMLQEHVAWFGEMSLNAVVSIHPAISTDKAAYINGESMQVTLIGAPPLTPVLWSTWKDGALIGAMDSNQGDATDSEGRWTGSGPAGVFGVNGSWKIQASIGSETAITHFQMSDSLTVAQPAPAHKALSASHVGGDYRLTEEPFLFEGAKFVRNLRTQSIFVYLTPGYATRNYPATSFGPGISNLEELARSAPYQELFAMNFSTFVITAHTFASKPWIDTHPHGPLPAEVASAQIAEFRALTKYLLTQYQGSGKTFILKNWEGDWLMNETFDPLYLPDSTQTQAMRDWFTARHAGIVLGRSDAGSVPGVQVLDAVEFTRVGVVRAGLPSLVRDVLPYVDSDFIAYSAWETINNPLTQDLRRRTLEDVAFLRGHPAAKGRPLIITEFGFRENVHADAGERTGIVARAFLDGGASLAFFWQAIDNECEHDQPASPGVCPGLALLRPDGSRTGAWTALRELTGAQDNAAFISWKIPKDMKPGRVYSVSITMRNTGNVVWDAANGFLLAPLSPEAVRIQLPSNAAVMPGEAYTFVSTVTAPSIAGTFPLQWTMTQEGVGSFGTPTGIKVVKVRGSEKSQANGGPLLTPAASVEDARIFPNPLRPAQGHTSMSFSNLPVDSRVRIYSLVGQQVRDLRADAAGLARWDGRNDAGTDLGSGVYFVLLQGDGQKSTTKVAIQR